MWRAALAGAVLLAGCRPVAAPPRAETPGDRLEAAARQAGLVGDPARASPVGLYASEADRVCVVPGARGDYRIGALVRHDEAQGCLARGTARREGDRLTIAFGACRIDARFEGDRIVLPAEQPGACDALCTGRASLSALAVDRLSEGMAEATAQGDGRGSSLCAD